MLTEMGWIHNFEYETAEGLSLDLADPETRKAIEVDGPSHYLRDVTSGEYVVNGPTQFKTRLLEAHGWKIAHIPFFEWNERSDAERRQLLVGKARYEMGVDIVSREVMETSITEATE